jgi:hypothetical protein
MGLFSGSFGTGLAQGIASGIDRSLQVALDNRERDMSRHKQFLETRRAQKMDLAEAHDRRAEAALERFLVEFDGDVAKSLAAYQAAGGTVDAVESVIAEIDETRKYGGQYNVDDWFDFQNINLENFADLTLEQARGSIYMDVPEVTSTYRDTSGLGGFGLGLRGQRVDEPARSVNELMPGRERVSIEGLSSATYNPTGTAAAIKYAQDQELRQYQLAEARERATGGSFDDGLKTRDLINIHRTDYGTAAALRAIQYDADSEVAYYDGEAYQGRDRVLVAQQLAQKDLNDEFVKRLIVNQTTGRIRPGYESILNATAIDSSSLSNAIQSVGQTTTGQLSAEITVEEAVAEAEALVQSALASNTFVNVAGLRAQLASDNVPIEQINRILAPLENTSTPQ